MKPRELAWVVVVFATATSCRISPLPDPATGLGHEAVVNSAVLNEQIGRVFVESDGLWAFMGKEGTSYDAYQPGDLVAFGDLDEQSRHLFVVIEVARWGVRLQRLDADPIQGRTAGALVPLSQLDRATGARWGFCAGADELRTAKCLDQQPQGTRWWVYEVSADGRVGGADTDRGTTSQAGTLPVSLRGQVSVGPHGRDIVGVDLPSSWIAVASATPGARPTRPRIVVDPGCTNVGSPHRDALDAQWMTATVTPPTGPLETSAEAVRHGADAIVWCSGGQARVAVPTLYRPRLPVAGRGFDLPPMFGTTPIVVPSAAIGATDWIARLGAALATGDFPTADYLAETISRRFDGNRPLDRVMVDSMAAVASGGRPEAAARMGAWATRLQWNPKNSAAWQIGMASVESAIGNRKAAITRTATLTNVLDRSGDADRRAWVAYFWAISEIGARGALGDYTSAFEDRVDLVLAARAEAARASDQPLVGLRPDFEANNALELWKALAGELGELGCDADRCAADSYGRLWAEGEVAAEDLSRVRRIHLRPGYRANSAGDDLLASLRALVSVYPLVDDDDADDHLRIVTATAVGWIRGGCAGNHAPTVGLDLLHRDGVDAHLRTEAPRPMDTTLVWLATRGVAAACSDTEGLAAAASQLANDIGTSTTVPAELLALHIEKATPTELVNVLETATKFAVEHEHGERCASWTVALASAYADAGEFERALRWIRAAARCDVSKRQSIDLVSAYLNFQRTASTSAGFGDETTRALREIAHVDVPRDACVGVRELDYRLIGALPAPERNLAARMRITAARTGEDLSLVTANDRLAIAREHLASVVTLFDSRSFPEAAMTLGFARDTFEAVGHEVGLARVRWLDQTLFAGQGAKVAAGDAAFGKVGYAPLRSKKSLSEVATEGDRDARLAIALLNDDVKVAQLLSTDATPALCEPRPRRTRNVMIDRVDGKLQPTRPRDGGPKIELIEPGTPSNEPVDDLD